jgi:hypothetical protein
MLNRCYNPNNPAYGSYGERGITACERWKNLNNFITDIESTIGKCPPDYSFERINNDGNYEPGNVKWATRKEQQNNRRPLRTRLSQFTTAELKAELARRGEH